MAFQVHFVAITWELSFSLQIHMSKHMQEEVPIEAYYLQRYTAVTVTARTHTHKHPTIPRMHMCNEI